MISSQRIYAVSLRHFYLFKKSPVRLTQMFVWSVLELMTWIFITKYIHSVGGEKLSFISFMVGAFIFWNVFARTVNGIGASFLEDVWTRNFINIFATPLNLPEYIVGIIGVSLINTFATVGGTLFLAKILLSYSIAPFGFFIFPFILIILFSAMAVGISIIALILRFGSSLESLVWSVPALLIPFSGIFYPIELLPKIFHPVAYLIPLTNVFESIRNISMGNKPDIYPLIMSFGLSIIFFACAVLILNFSYKSVLKRGLFTRFMTE